MRDIIGRTQEKEKLKQIFESDKSEFVAIYGRRRVGKTFLIREYFDHKFSFYITGIKEATVKEQLINFQISFQKSFKEERGIPINWQEAFTNLITGLEKSTEVKKEMYQDEFISWRDENEPLRPRNALYWVGYLICKSYYENSNDKQQAVYDILNVNNNSDFYKKSKVEDYIIKHFK